MSFHNTNNESGIELGESIVKAIRQEELILEYFKLHPQDKFTPFEIQSALGLMATPITSIRRAITNLTADDKLIKTDKQKVGDYGKKNFCWRLNVLDRQYKIPL